MEGKLSLPKLSGRAVIYNIICVLARERIEVKLLVEALVFRKTLGLRMVFVRRLSAIRVHRTVIEDILLLERVPYSLP